MNMQFDESTETEMTARTAKTPVKVRVQFEFTLEALARLDALKEVTQASTRAEIVRKSLRLYEWFVNEAESDNTIKSVDRNGEVVSQFPAWLLMK